MTSYRLLLTVFPILVAGLGTPLTSTVNSAAPYARVSGAPCTFFDSARGATYNLSAFSSPLKLVEECHDEMCGTAGSYTLVGLCVDVPAPSIDGTPCTAPAAPAFRVTGAPPVPGAALVLNKCERMGDAAARGSASSLPFNKTGLRLAYGGGDAGCDAPAGPRSADLLLECDASPVPLQRRRAGVRTDEPPEPPNWLYVHATYLNLMFTGCGVTAVLRSAAFCPAECARAPGRGLVCGGPRAGVCDFVPEEGRTRCLCFEGFSGAACESPAAPGGGAVGAPARKAPPLPFERVGGSSCVYRDAERGGLVYNLSSLPQPFAAKGRTDRLEEGQNGWMYVVGTCADAPNTGWNTNSPCGEPSGGVFQITGVQGPGVFDSHECKVMADHVANYVASALPGPGAPLGLQLRGGGGTPCGPWGARSFVMTFECDPIDAPMPPLFSRSYLLRSLWATEKSHPGVAYEVEPDALPRVAFTAKLCEALLHMRGPAFCPLQCARSTGGHVCGGPSRGRCATLGDTTRCWCFSGWTGAACDEGAPPGAAPSHEAPPSAGAPWLLRFSWLLHGRGDWNAALIAASCACGVTANCATERCAPKAAGPISRALLSSALLAGALLATLRAINADVCIGGEKGG